MLAERSETIGEATNNVAEYRALLLGWRETPDGWEGRVVRPVLDMEDGKWRPREQWLPAENLKQT